MKDLRGLHNHRVLNGVGFGIRKSRAARDAARAFVGFRDRRTDGQTLHAKACSQREATGRARDRAKGEPYFCTRQHPGYKKEDRMVERLTPVP